MGMLTGDDDLTSSTLDWKKFTKAVQEAGYFIGGVTKDILRLAINTMKLTESLIIFMSIKPFKGASDKNSWATGSERSTRCKRAWCLTVTIFRFRQFREGIKASPAAVSSALHSRSLRILQHFFRRKR